MDMNRRDFLRDSGIGITVAAITGPACFLTPAEAKAKQLPLKVLNKEQVRTLEAVAEVLLPGSAGEGIAWYIDDQLARDPNESLLIARFFHVSPPFADFYRGAIAAIDGHSHTLHSKPFHTLSAENQDQLIGSLFPEQPENWQGPPSPLVYLCLRNDVVDAFYGTIDGFEKLGIPYMAHIEPASKW